MDAPRGKSAIASTNSSKELSVLSKVSSIKYSAHMEAQSTDPNWASQTKDELFKLLYMTSKRGESNIYSPANNTDSMAPPHIGLAYNMYSQVPAINSSISSLLYEELQLGNSNLWNVYTNPISMFGQNTSQEINVNNIKISLMHILNFTSNRELKNNREADIPFISSFDQIAFDFVSSIFKGE